MKIGRGIVKRGGCSALWGRAHHYPIPYLALGSPQESSALQRTRNQRMGEDRTHLQLAKASSLLWLWDSRAVHVGEKGPSRLCPVAVLEFPFTGKQVLKRL